MESLRGRLLVEQTNQQQRFAVSGSGVIPSSPGADFSEVDIQSLGLLPWQIQLLHNTLALIHHRDPWVDSAAALTHFRLDLYLIYRYYAATDWAKAYNKKTFDAAVLATVNWRRAFGMHNINTHEFAHLVEAGLCYTGGYDQHGRVILYMKVNRAGKRMESAQTYLNLLMYTLERADRFCAERQNGANGEFISIIDLEGFSLSKGLPFTVIQDFFTHTAHYPFRLGAIYMINSNMAFNALWGLVKVMVPKRLSKTTYMLSKAEVPLVLCFHLGRDHVERAYGGTLPEGPGNASVYFNQGYWANQ